MYLEFDRVTDELRVLLHDFLDLPLLNVLGLVLLQEQDDPGTATKRFSVIWSDSEGTSGGRLPDVLLIIIMLCVDDNFLSS